MLSSSTARETTIMKLWHDWQGRAWWVDENGNPIERAPEYDE